MDHGLFHGEEISEMKRKPLFSEKEEKKKKRERKEAKINV
jgi:hypothetical protein